MTQPEPTATRPVCGEPADRRGFFRCGKPANHYGERHHADFGVGSYTWGFVPTASARADHPHTDPGDGRTECKVCGKYVWPAIHSCKGVPMTAQAKARGGIVRSDVTADNPGPLGSGCMFSDVARVFVLPDRTEEPK